VHERPARDLGQIGGARLVASAGFERRKDPLASNRSTAVMPAKGGQVDVTVQRS
jgi:hypothetical protein